MDGKRFDAFTRGFAKRSSRRAVLRTAAGAAVAASAGAIDLPEAQACSGTYGYCKHTRDCCPPLRCIWTECAECLADGHSCHDNPDCCSDVCESSKCIPKKACKKWEFFKRGCRDGRGGKGGKGGKGGHDKPCC